MLRDSQPSERALQHLVICEIVHEVLTVTGITTPGLGESVPLGDETLAWRAQLEGPQEVGNLLEFRAASVDLVNYVLHSVDAVLAEVLFDDVIGADAHTAPCTASADLGVTTLVEQLADGRQGGVTVGDVRVNELEHLHGGLVQLDEDTVVQLEQPEELEDEAGLGGDLVNTLDAHNKDHLGVSFLVERALGLSLATQLYEFALMLDVLLGVVKGAVPETFKTLALAFDVLGDLALLDLTQLLVALHLLLEALVALLLG
ncbi:Rpl7bp, putative [Babesia ovata]|uniref:Rpl7bp, putative n=1 Tax=Babesia ovata TaxID=189622 RepID=A0A2H6KJ94_9APIC|nr:Rpl7bp, putative [Babesia ovata]GBE63065.1 Rpl7bp, putative [Babesia ovata]